MTKSDAYFYRLAMPRPFAKGDGAALTAIGSSSGNNVNFLDGFPTPYSAPASNGGAFVTRGEMNAIGNLASQNQFYFLAGGINTFDATFAASIGGYPEGAVLKYLNNGYLYDVISLIDNNTVNFTAQGVDGVNWAYLSVAEKQVFDDVFFEGGTDITMGSGILAIVRAKKDAGIAVSAALSPVVGTQEQTYSVASFTGTFAGCGVMIKDCGSTAPSSISFPDAEVYEQGYRMNWQGWKSLFGDFTSLMKQPSGSGSYYDTQSEAGAASFLTQGNYYAIGFMCGEGTWNYTSAGSVIEIKKYTSVSGTLKLMYAQ